MLKKLLMLTIFYTGLSKASFLENPDLVKFLDLMAHKHHLDLSSLKEAFSAYDKSEEVLKKMDRQYEAKPWYEYKKILINQKRILEGQAFLTKYQEVLTQVEAKFGVDPKIITAIIGVESSYGQNKGNYPVLQSLATLSFYYPRRAEFFKKELEEFLLLCKTENLNPKDILGSFSGAIGAPQFMPSSYRKFGLDFSKGGQINLSNSMENAIASVANYLLKHNWQKNTFIALKIKHPKVNYQAFIAEKSSNPKPKYTLAALAKAKILGNKLKKPAETKAILLEFPSSASHKELWLCSDNFYSITRYNHSSNYAMAIYQLAKSL